MSSADKILGTVSGLPKKITDITDNIAKSGNSLDKMMTKLGNTLHKTGNGRIRNASNTISNAGKVASQKLQPMANAAAAAQKSLKDLQSCKEVATTSALVVNAVIDSCTGHLHPRANEKVLNKFNTDWDSWADTINRSFEKFSPSGQTKVLEQLGKNMFGDNLYYMGSAIKRESSGVFGGIADFEDSLHAFRGSYRDPVAAAKKIEQGVKGIVAATERVAGSINSMIKIYQNGMNPNTKSAGSAILTSLENLHDTKAISVLNKTLTMGGGAATLLADGGNLTGALKSKNPTTIFAAGSKAVKDVKEIAKELKNTKQSLNSTSLSQGATAEQASQKQYAQQGQLSQQSQQAQEGQEPQQDSENKQKNATIQAQSDSYICSGATMRCTKGTSLARLTVLPSRTVFLTGQPMANISDHLSMINLAPFGRCRSLGFPATASATAANHGSLTPMPCMHNTPFLWMRGKDDYIIKGDSALLKSSTCSCMWGGTISLVTDGQAPTGLINLTREERETFEQQ